jgi:hypothetical protein
MKLAPVPGAYPFHRYPKGKIMTTINTNTNTNTNANAAAADATTATLAPTALGAGSLQMMFAQLQMGLCQQTKSNAMEYMDSIKETQKEQKKIAAFLQEARQKQSDAKNESDTNKKESGEKESTMMSTEMEDYFKQNGLAYCDYGVSRRQNKEEWDTAISSLQTQLDSIGTDTQTKMVYVQDFMGQYNSYLQGANSTIQQSNQTLAQLAKT